MSLIDWLFFSLALAAGLAGLVRLPGYWAGRWAQPDKAEPWWPWGEPLWHAWRRCLPMGVFGWLDGWVVFLMVRLGPEDPDKAPPQWGLAPLVLVLLLCVLAAVSVSLWNRPKWCIAPRYRSEPGAIKEWLEVRRCARRRRAEPPGD